MIGHGRVEALFIRKIARLDRNYQALLTINTYTDRLVVPIPDDLNRNISTTITMLLYFNFLYDDGEKDGLIKISCQSYCGLSHRGPGDSFPPRSSRSDLVVEE
ncbi:hypothetical protein L1887_21237 [Cichorium endivia]|nr:hypothetical protein L1887_21237 [Cichorium endivia]